MGQSMYTHVAACKLMEMGFSLYRVLLYTVFAEWIMPVKGVMGIYEEE
jgi:hypothetical protein